MAGLPDGNTDLPSQQINAVATPKRNFVTVFFPDALKMPSENIARLVQLALEDVKNNLPLSVFKRLQTDRIRIDTASGVEPGLAYEFQVSHTWPRYEKEIARVMNATFREYAAFTGDKEAGVTDEKILDEMEKERRDRITVIPGKKANDVLVFFPHTLHIFPVELDRLMAIAQSDLQKQELPVKKRDNERLLYYSNIYVEVKPIKLGHRRSFLGIAKDMVKKNHLLEEQRFGSHYLVSLPHTTGGENFTNDMVDHIKETMQYFTSLRQASDPKIKTEEILEKMEKSQKQIGLTKLGNNRFKLAFYKYNPIAAMDIVENIRQALQAEGIETNPPYQYFEGRNQILNCTLATKESHNTQDNPEMEKIIQRMITQFSVEEHADIESLTATIGKDNKRRLALKSSIDKHKAREQEDIKTLEAVIIGQLREIFENPSERPWEKSDTFKGKDSSEIAHALAATLAPAIIAAFKGKGTNKNSLIVVADHAIRDVLQREFGVSEKEAVTIGFKLTQEDKNGAKESSLEKAITDYCNAHARARKG
jgi:hypothetical protein